MPLIYRQFSPVPGFSRHFPEIQNLPPIYTGDAFETGKGIVDDCRVWGMSDEDAAALTAAVERFAALSKEWDGAEELPEAINPQFGAWGSGFTVSPPAAKGPRHRI